MALSLDGQFNRTTDLGYLTSIKPESSRLIKNYSAGAPGSPASVLKEAGALL
jgi:hypothetical protein